MPHDIRKVRKMRGSRTHGWGRVSQHRRSEGGRGNAGLISHKRSWMLKYDPEHFGKHGFKRAWIKRDVIAVNVGELDEMVDVLLAEGKAERKEDKIFVNLDVIGVNKLLGRGSVTKPLLIKVKSYSESASRKVLEVGGQIMGDIGE